MNELPNPLDWDCLGVWENLRLFEYRSAVPTEYVITDLIGNHVGNVKFQDGPTKAVGYNGIPDVLMLIMLARRLRSWLNTIEESDKGSDTGKCTEKALACVLDAIHCFENRSLWRVVCGIKGTGAL